MVILIIVESPSKCPKLKSILGNNYNVQASCGHLMDIPANLTWIKDNNLDPSTIPYRPLSDKKDQISKLRFAAKQASKVLIASDMDREGEAIGFHICKVLELDPEKTERILFDQITPEAIEYAIQHPTSMRTEMYRAQQARRIVDLLFGYTISPRLWHIAPKLSAGRCQSPALRWLYERQQQFLGFQPGASHFDISASLTPELTAKCQEHEVSEQHAIDMLHILEKIEEWYIEKDIAKQSKENPPLSFTTSSLQQECHKKWHWNPKHTMSVAQKLYENGHITYMRTDCTQLSDTFIKEVTATILKLFGEAYYNNNQTKTKTKKKSSKSGVQAQEAHEPIRPVYSNTFQLDDNQSSDAQKLYLLIHRRAVSSVMMPCVSNVHSFLLKDTKTKKQTLVASWKGIQFPGFKAWDFIKSPPAQSPPFQCPYTKHHIFQTTMYIAQEKHASRPRPYSAGDMVKLLEEKGIGRPSTYSSILERLETRKYIDTSKKTWEETLSNMPKKKITTIKIDMVSTPPHWETQTVTTALSGDLNGRYRVTTLGEQVATHLMQNYEELVSQSLTQKLESELDAITRGEKTYTSVVGTYYNALQALPQLTIPKSSKRELGKNNEGTFAVLRTKNGEAVAFFPHTTSTKPIFSSIYNNVHMDDVTLEQAQQWLRGEIPQQAPLTFINGDPVYAKTGKYGHYLVCGNRKCRFMDESVTVDNITPEQAQQWLSSEGDGVVKIINDVFSIRRKNGSIFLMKKQKNAKKPLFLSLKTHISYDKLKVSDCKSLFQMKSTTIQ